MIFEIKAKKKNLDAIFHGLVSVITKVLPELSNFWNLSSIHERSSSENEGGFCCCCFGFIVKELKYSLK